MKKSFIEWKPSTRSSHLLVIIDDIITDYQSQGYTLTLRQLYYQLVSRDLIPNTVQQYNSIGNLVSNGRMAGLIDWSAIEDRGRYTQSNNHWSSPSQILRAAAAEFYKDKWADMYRHVEVWSEKDAVTGIVKPICESLDVSYMANKGYSSQTALYNAADRFKGKIDEKINREVTVLYVGDHDPSGMDMVRDISERLELFMEDYACYLTVERIALNMDQVNLYNPPENPAKTTDSRYASYRAEYGESSWELDALDPKVLSSIVNDAILEHIDLDEFNRVTHEDKEGKKLLNNICEDIDK